jgi:hypothetical protein
VIVSRAAVAEWRVRGGRDEQPMIWSAKKGAKLDTGIPRHPPVRTDPKDNSVRSNRRNAGEERASFLTIMLRQIRSLAIMHCADVCAKNSGSSRRRSNRYYRSPVADVIRDQIEIVRESRRFMLHMQASDTAGTLRIGGNPFDFSDTCDRRRARPPPACA